MSKISNIDFFKEHDSAKSSGLPKKTEFKEIAQTDRKCQTVNSVRFSPEIRQLLRETSEMLREAGEKKLASHMAGVTGEAIRDRFCVAVVGEFSKGKSTLLNSILEQKVLPVDALPSTAMLTLVRYSKKQEMAVFDETGRKIKSAPLGQKAWKGLTAENFGKEDSRGSVLVGVDCPWLLNGIEFIDTPGAGDLEQRRERVISDAIQGCDGAIIVIDANAPLSMSEQLFIRQRLVARKTPFLALAVTKMDLMKKSERAAAMDYIMQKLKLMELDIPVFIPYETEMEGNKYDSVIGIDKLQEQIENWIKDPERARLTEEWLAVQAASDVSIAIASLEEQLLLLDADEDKRLQLIRKKKDRLSEAGLAWNELRLHMLERENTCYAKVMEKIDECKTSIVERLQYEAAHVSDPLKWWTEDYPYRFRMELANMASAIENVASRWISEDVKWFNYALEQNFKTHILYERKTIADKNTIGTPNMEKELELNDLSRQRNLARVGTAILSVTGIMLFSAMGFLPIVASTGVATGGAIISENIFKKKIADQREILKTAIARVVPIAIDDATEESENRLKAVYDDIIDSAVIKEQSWMEVQEAAIEKANTSKNEEKKANLETNLNRLLHLKEKLETF